jgi:hypothetical protein
MAIDTQKFVRKPLYVDSVRISSTNFDEIAEWCQGEVEYEPQEGQGSTNGKKYIRVRVHNPKNPRQTKAFVGDWLLYTERGYKVYTNKAFHASFDKVENPEINEEEGDDTEFPLFYIDPATGFLTEESPHEGALALNFDELISIIRQEIADDDNAEKSSNQEELPVVVVEEPVPVEEPSSETPPSSVEESPNGENQMASESGMGSVPRGKTVLTIKDQKEMDSDELRELLRSGEYILAQDLES